MDIIKFIAQCVAFQNKYGRDNWEKNKKGIYGSEESQAIARSANLKIWLLRAIYWDLDSIIKDHHNLSYGQGGSHVWICNAENNERLAMIFVRENEDKLAVKFENPDQFPEVGLEDVVSPENADDPEVYRDHIQKTCDRLSDLLSKRQEAYNAKDREHA